MEKLEILDILIDWNFWKKEIETGVKRQDLVKQIFEVSKTKEIVVIKGIRRSGKSTILMQFCKELIISGIRKEDILIINFEDPRFKEMNLDLLNKIYEIYLTEISPKEKHYVILDEVQSVKGWEKFARYLHENKKINVYVTGSSSKLLSSEYSTILAGRHLDIEITPLTFKEYLEFKGINTNNLLEISKNKLIIKREFQNYLKWGGFPKVVLTDSEKEKKELLETYFRDIIIKDIIFRYKIKEIEKLEDLAKYYLSNISTLQSFNNIKNVLKLSLDSVERFSKYLSEVYLLSFIKKFSFSSKEQLLNPRKIYCIDLGLRNNVSFIFSKDFGRLMENIVYNELKKRKLEIYYWKSPQQEEVDFMVKEGLKIDRLIQVCWSIEDKKTKDREIRGILKACKEFKKKQGTILTEDMEGEETIDKIKIKYLPLWKWLLLSNKAAHQQRRNR